MIKKDFENFENIYNEFGMISSLCFQNFQILVDYPTKWYVNFEKCFNWLKCCFNP